MEGLRTRQRRTACALSILSRDKSVEGQMKASVAHIVLAARTAVKRASAHHFQVIDGMWSSCGFGSFWRIPSIDTSVPPSQGPL